MLPLSQLSIPSGALHLSMSPLHHWISMSQNLTPSCSRCPGPAQPRMRPPMYSYTYQKGRDQHVESGTFLSSFLVTHCCSHQEDRNTTCTLQLRPQGLLTIISPAMSGPCYPGMVHKKSFLCFAFHVGDNIEFNPWSGSFTCTCNAGKSWSPG